MQFFNNQQADEFKDFINKLFNPTVNENEKKE